MGSEIEPPVICVSLRRESIGAIVLICLYSPLTCLFLPYLIFLYDQRFPSLWYRVHAPEPSHTLILVCETITEAETDQPYLAIEDSYRRSRNVLLSETKVDTESLLSSHPHASDANPEPGGQTNVSSTFSGHQ